MELTNLTLSDHRDIKREQKALNKLYKAHHNLDMDCISILDYLEHNKDATINDLHEELGLCKSSIYVKTSLLKERGLIKKEKAIFNGRMYIMSLEDRSRANKITKDSKNIVQSRSVLML